MRRLLTAWLAIAFLFSCGKQQSQPNESTQQQPLVTAPVPARNKTTNNLSHRINRDEAARLVAAYLNHPNLGPYATQSNLGGLFDLSVFHLSPDDAGSLLWYCYDEKESPGKQLYLAASKASGYTPSVTKEATDDLWKPYDYFRYTGSGTTEADVLKFITGHTYGKAGMSPKVPQKQVRQQSSDFMTEWLPQMDSDPSHLMKYSFGFFGEMSSDFQIRKLIAQPGAVGVRYYFGLEEKDSEGIEINNKIRVILVAVDEFGKNILSGTRDDDELMLQKSFPPPPNN